MAILLRGNRLWISGNCAHDTHCRDTSPHPSARKAPSNSTLARDHIERAGRERTQDEREDSGIAGGFEADLEPSAPQGECRLNVLDLFSGIGGFSLGLERAGMRTVAFCEIEPFQRGVLRKNFPHVPQYEDVRTLTAETLARDGINFVDVICGGFPCQDISAAGKGAGIEGERSGLWSEIARLVGELRPRYLVVENSSMLLSRGLGKVLGDLAALGYDAEWECIPAASVGAPHIRDRIWLLAYPRQELRQDVRGHVGFCDVLPRRDRGDATEWGTDRELAPLVPGVDPRAPSDWWLHQSRVDRTANGLPGQLDRIGACGNAVVPQIPELIGRAIMRTA
mgnify:FL=1